MQTSCQVHDNICQYNNNNNNDNDNNNNNVRKQGTRTFESLLVKYLKYQYLKCSAPLEKQMSVSVMKRINNVEKCLHHGPL